VYVVTVVDFGVAVYVVRLPTWSQAYAQDPPVEPAVSANRRFEVER
jgi:hypothetical protein